MAPPTHLATRHQPPSPVRGHARHAGRAGEPLALLLLPCRLEEFERADHARSLLAIPRALALEPRRMRPPGRFTEAVAVRQARRLRLPGEPRLVVLYHPGQYPLGRAICSHYADVELWYVRPRTPDPATEPGRLAEFDELAVGRATRVVRAEDPDDTEALRGRLLALEVINPRAFIPGALISRR